MSIAVCHEEAAWKDSLPSRFFAFAIVGEAWLPYWMASVVVLYYLAAGEIHLKGVASTNLPETSPDRMGCFCRLSFLGVVTLVKSTFFRFTQKMLGEMADS